MVDDGPSCVITEPADGATFDKVRQQYSNYRQSFAALDGSEHARVGECGIDGRLICHGPTVGPRAEPGGGFTVWLPAAGNS